MAFKDYVPAVQVAESPDKLFLELPRRKFPDVLPHQREIMRAYTPHIDDSDVALQLPTGSGKTLVGLLIGEWLRIKNKEKILYLCPTKQLVNQVVTQAQAKYGLSATAFVGSHQTYTAAQKTDYRSADKIAVTTYKSLFNSSPYFEDADVLILDDAHTSEDHIASMWSMKISRQDHANLHTAVSHLLRPTLALRDFARLRGEIDDSADKKWVDKIPTPVLFEIQDQLIAILDEHTKEIKDLKYSWPLLRDHLHACHVYISAHEILVRPIVPPTWTHAPFSNARQRIYMSATLGAGGDLERLTGRKNITRVPISEEWKRHGVGRRFFLFPGMSLNESECEKLKCQLINQAGRAVVLLPSELASQKFKSVLSTGCPMARIFDAHDIESSKSGFSESSKAVAVIANRYDGIDFPGDDSRLLLVEGLPKAMNLQERFFMSRMAANLLFNDRVQTRVLQAIGRCTRSMEDYSAVVVSGAELPDYLSDLKRRRFFHPELQAELSFGERQSKATTAKDMLENFQMFLANGLEWERANQQIIAERKTLNRLPFPAIEELGGVVRDEIEFQMRLWQGDFAEAHQASERVLGKLMHSDLQGYRALWHYLSGCALWLMAQQGGSSDTKARMQFAKAKDCAKGVAWLVGLSRFQPNPDNIAVDDSLLYAQLEKVELTLESLGTLHDRSFVKVEKEILEGLRSTRKGPFESAHRWIGELLGFDARNVETTGAPDPWWILKNLCLVFEDHAGALDSSSLDVTKARQVSSHPNWIRANVQGAEILQILPVICTPVSKVQQGAVAHLTEVALWELSAFQKWSEQSLAVLRSLRTSFVEPGDLRWRTEAAEIFKANLMDGQSLFDHLKSQRANVLLKPVP